jgi:hypothetical protein
VVSPLEYARVARFGIGNRLEGQIDGLSWASNGFVNNHGWNHPLMSPLSALAGQGRLEPLEVRTTTCRRIRCCWGRCIEVMTQTPPVNLFFRLAIHHPPLRLIHQTIFHVNDLLPLAAQIEEQEQAKERNKQKESNDNGDDDDRYVPALTWLLCF